jgi:hypothetical protein
MSISRVSGSMKTALTRRLAVAVLASAFGFSALGITSSAEARTTRSNFVTPIWQMECNTWTSADNSYGGATCAGLGKWRVVVSCSFGWTYTSLWYINSPGQTQTATAGSCWWGVDSVSIQESTS